MHQVLNEVEHSYFSVDAELSLRNQFELRMLEENRIPGLLRLSVCDDDGRLKLNYDITGMDPLSEAVQLRKLKAQDLRQLILTLKHVVTGMEPYLMNASGIVLHMDSVYISPRSRAPCFLFLPGRKADFSSELSDFLQALLGASDHDDYASVVLAYRLYKASLEPHNALERLEQILISRDSPADAPVSSADGQRITVPEMLAEATEEHCVVEIREVPDQDYGNVLPAESGERRSLFRRLFRKNSAPETGAPGSITDAEETEWIQSLQRQ